jgi:hypothetical protein
MLSYAAIIALINTTGSVAMFATALIKLVEAERARQFEIVRQLGTLECAIENRRLVGQDFATLQKQYEQLATFVKLERGKI